MFSEFKHLARVVRKGDFKYTSLAPLYTGNIDPGDLFSLKKISMALGEYHFPYASSFDSRRCDH